MRKHTVALLGAALLAGVPACVNLDEDVVTGLTPGSYGTQAVFESLVNASYEPLRTFYAQERGFTVTEFGTDIFTKGADGSHKYINDYTTQLNPDAQFFRETWVDFYRAINTTNAAIDQAPVVVMDSALKAHRVAEARFLRAGGFRVRCDHRRPEVRGSEPSRRSERVWTGDQGSGPAPARQSLPHAHPRCRLGRRRGSETAGGRLRERGRLRPARDQFGTVRAAAALQGCLRLRQRAQSGGHLVDPVHHRSPDHRHRQQWAPLFPGAVRRMARDDA